MRTRSIETEEGWMDECQAPRSTEAPPPRAHFRDPEDHAGDYARVAGSLRTPLHRRVAMALLVDQIPVTVSEFEVDRKTLNRVVAEIRALQGASV